VNFEILRLRQMLELDQIHYLVRRLIMSKFNGSSTVINELELTRINTWTENLDIAHTWTENLDIAHTWTENLDIAHTWTENLEISHSSHIF
jgi:hypothetical protein